MADAPGPEPGGGRPGREPDGLAPAGQGPRARRGAGRLPRHRDVALAKLPPPPPVERLREIPPAIAVLPPGTPLWRLYFRGGAFPGTWSAFRHFGPARARFDHHLPPPRVQARGILYAARDAITCIAEVFQRGRQILPEEDEPWLVCFRTARPVALLDLTGRWTTRAGASMAIHTEPHAQPRAWSRALYEAFPEAQGLLCCSSMDANRETVALYERARGALPGRAAFHRPLSNPELRPLLERAAAELGYGIGP